MACWLRHESKPARRTPCIRCVRRKSNALHEVDKARLCDNEFDKEMSGTEFPHSGQAKLSSSWLNEFGRECLKALGQHLFGNCRLARAKSERGATPL